MTPKNKPAAFQAVHDKLSDDMTDAQFEALAQEEDAVAAERAKALQELNMAPKIGELTIQDGVVVEQSFVEAQAAAGQDVASHNTAGRQV